CPSALPYTTLFRSPISLSTTHFSKRAPIKGSWEIMLPADCSGLVHPGQGTIPVRLFQVGHLIAIRESFKVLLEILCGRGGFLLGDGARHLQLIALEFSVEIGRASCREGVYISQFVNTLSPNDKDITRSCH